MSIAAEISRIQSAKADIKAAIEAKGVTVPSSATIDTYDDYVSQISGGGGVPIPSNLSSILLDNYGNITSATIKSGTTIIETGAFHFCTKLASVTIPNSVTSIERYAFSNCQHLSSVEIPSGVTTISNNCFSTCSALQSITMSDIVTSIGDYGFSDCGKLKRLNSNVDGVLNIPTSLTSIGTRSFASCYGFTSVNMPNGVTTIGNYAFYNNSHLQSITIEAVTPPTLGNNAFNNTNNCPIYVPAASLDAYKAASGWSSYASRIQAIPNS